jgi:hypothetical protein
VTWNQIVALGIPVSVAALALGMRLRGASVASLERRCRWAIRLALGFGAVLLLGLIVPLVRFAWASADAGASVEDRALLLGVCIASAFNLVLGFLTFGTLPTLIAFRVARLRDARAEG